MANLIRQSPGIYKKPGDNNLYDARGNLLRGTARPSPAVPTPTPAPVAPPPTSAAPGEPTSPAPTMPAPPQQQKDLPTLSSRGNWQYNGTWVNQEGYKVDGYGKVIPNQAGPFVPNQRNPFFKQAPAPATPEPAPQQPPATTTPPPATEPAPTTPAPTEPTPPRIGETAPPLTQTPAPNMANAPAFGSTPETPGPAPMGSEAEKRSTDVYNQMMEFYKNFNAKDIFKNMQPQFDTSMQQAGDAFYNEFSRRSEPEFQRQQADLERVLMERGINPGSEQYTYQMNQLAQQQNDARQTARNQAAQQSLAYQQQLFGQGKDIALMPMTLATQLQTPALAEGQFGRDIYKIGVQGAEDRKTVALDLKNDLQLLDSKSRIEMEQLIAKGDIDLRNIGAEMEGKLKERQLQIDADLDKLNREFANGQITAAEKFRQDKILLAQKGKIDERVTRIAARRSGGGGMSEQEKLDAQYNAGLKEAIYREWEASQKEKGEPSDMDTFMSIFATQGQQGIIDMLKKA